MKKQTVKQKRKIIEKIKSILTKVFGNTEYSDTFVDNNTEEDDQLDDFIEKCSNGDVLSEQKIKENFNYWMTA